MRSIPIFVLSMLAGGIEHRQPHNVRPISRTPRVPYAGIEWNPIKSVLRQRRAANSARNFATGHWQHRVITAVPV